jgi:hypothetical protein
MHKARRILLADVRAMTPAFMLAVAQAATERSIIRLSENALKPPPKQVL